ncbi:hypothetical protein E4T38_04508 [Aureobasidium subglaciale]|nr:hypothetical protein E4T38_04508 [Aureobasidium subglaciale]KAI5223857.1 hypothetical protein E4T40_04284 [Aureobasidium subglaciale]KAI5227373.1 hypothetical protein E4T41_04366 [Aureobasidium subglaciale]KAI5262750.1 hypothetical protein E4T46_04252 [Aureobasidium subglaciale]
MSSSPEDSPPRLSALRGTQSNSELALDPSRNLTYTPSPVETTFQRPRSSSEGVLEPFFDDIPPGAVATTSPDAVPTGPSHMFGRSCPDNNPNCHWHHQQMQHCHVPWKTCKRATQAIRQFYFAGEAWLEAPEGWNAEHEHCLRTNNKCPRHSTLEVIRGEMAISGLSAGKPTNHHEEGKQN